jgi:hypothetical protein
MSKPTDTGNSNEQVTIRADEIVTVRRRDRTSFLRSIGTAFISAAAVLGTASQARASADPKYRNDENYAVSADPKRPTDRDPRDPSGYNDHDYSRSGDPKRSSDPDF